MGQTIEVKSVVLGDVALFDTDRTDDRSGWSRF